MTQSHPIVFLVDVDNTLVDNDGIQQDLKDHLERTYGLAARERYWRILEDLFVELGYRDYIGALQRFRVEHPREVELLSRWATQGLKPDTTMLLDLDPAVAAQRRTGPADRLEAESLELFAEAVRRA